MKIIVPMAGMGKRMRPHTLTIPKPLVKIAGKPIVQRLVEDISSLSEEKIEEIAFIVGDFGEEVEKDLIKVAESLGAKGSIYHQEEALGTAHAILCAAPSLEGNLIVAFADTLFRADFHINTSDDGVIWTSQVEDPSAYGVVKLDDNNTVEAFVEKPEEFVSDQAIIGIYYFRDGEMLRDELQYLIDNDIRIKGGEFGLTDALENMKVKGQKFKIDTVIEWWDCGNKKASVYTNQRVLANSKENMISADVKQENSLIIEPCYIGEGVSIKNAVVGPYVSIGPGCQIDDSIIRNSVVQENSTVVNTVLKDSMVGSHAELNGKALDLSISDYSTLG